MEFTKADHVWKVRSQVCITAERVSPRCRSRHRSLELSRPVPELFPGPCLRTGQATALVPALTGIGTCEAVVTQVNGWD
ncbi:MAG TPA: hypothetical protein DHW34_03830 [Actinobacteria bacterium]|nr:hypothetical protein [Actinomycetota bacterium]